jgi:mono/diheme cytochrome c family protein
MKTWMAVAGSFVVSCFVMVLAGSPPVAAQQKPAVKGVPADRMVSIEGKDSYDAYCAVCHGKAGKGDGPAAPAMKMPVPDLTMMAQRNKGKFDALAARQAIESAGRVSSGAHGIDDMPIWGDVFRGEGTPRSTLRVQNLVKYLESIQAGG